MNPLRRIVATAAVALTMAAGTTALAPNASATTSASGYDCNTSNGFLCIKRTGAHAHASYLNQGSSTKYIQLWIWCSTGQWRSKAVNVRPGQLVYADYDAPGGQDGFYPICGASILDARNVPPTGIINTRQV